MSLLCFSCELAAEAAVLIEGPAFITRSHWRICSHYSVAFCHRGGQRRRFLRGGTAPEQPSAAYLRTRDQDLVSHLQLE